MPQMMIYICMCPISNYKIQIIKLKWHYLASEMYEVQTGKIICDEYTQM